MSENTPMDGTTDPTDPTDPTGTTGTTAETAGPVAAGPAPVPHDSPWHPVHIPHLVMGLAFLGLVAVWALVVPLDAVQLPHARWLLPLPWLVAGAAGLVATVLSGRRRRP